jgi:predicted lipid-binding transport protein (Tim44 family)
VKAAVIPLQVVELVIVAAVAAVVLFQLYSVLGRRVGRQPEDGLQAARAILPGRTPARVEEPKPTAALDGLPALKARDSSFDPARFLEGARNAYQMIVRAYVAGDRDELKPLTTPDVFKAFDAGIAQRDADGRTEQVEFLQGPRADLDKISLAGDLAQVRVRFLAELRSRSKDIKGEAVDDRRTAELWTFERLVTSRDPNWALARVEAAEA